MKFVFRALLLQLIFLVFSFLRKGGLELFLFSFVEIHCKFYFPYSNGLITLSPSLHNMNRLRVGKQKIPKVVKKSPRGIKEGVLNLVKCERISVQRVLLFSFQVNSLFLHSHIPRSSLFSLNSFSCEGELKQSTNKCPTSIAH